jgi:hypothetical protein
MPPALRHDADQKTGITRVRRIALVERAAPSAFHIGAKPIPGWPPGVPRRIQLIPGEHALSQSTRRVGGPAV